MTQVLFMPLLQIPSGHHHVADCIKEQLNQSALDFTCEKIEILSTCYGKVETFISSLYLETIHRIPGVYSGIYKTLAVKGASRKHYYLYEKLFLNKIRQIIENMKPDIIVCTHALPSYLVNRLKENNEWQGILVNVYTDYFINDLWGINSVDYHFVPSIYVKNLLKEKGVTQKKISTTGIPIHPIFNQSKVRKQNNGLTFLISGGNMGAGSIKRFILQLKPSGAVTYKVLCGKNINLYQWIEKLNHPHIKAVPYLSSKEDMNQLYNEVDAIITKPGGVTISECIRKRIPIFVYESLPGQEEFNLNYLKKLGLVSHLENWKKLSNIERVMLGMYKRDSPELYERMEQYHKDLNDDNIIEVLNSFVV